MSLAVNTKPVRPKASPVHCAIYEMGGTGGIRPSLKILGGVYGFGQFCDWVVYWCLRGFDGRRSHRN